MANTSNTFRKCTATFRTSPPVCQRVPSHFNWTLPYPKCTATFKTHCTNCFVSATYLIEGVNKQAVKQRSILNFIIILFIIMKILFQYTEIRELKFFPLSDDIYLAHSSYGFIKIRMKISHKMSHKGIFNSLQFNYCSHFKEKLLVRILRISADDYYIQQSNKWLPLCHFHSVLIN